MDPDEAVAHLTTAGSIDFTVTSGHVRDERALRKESDERNRAAMKTYRDLDDGRRAALCSLVSDALTEMAANVEDWLAGSLVASTNEKIGVHVLFRLGNIDDQVVRLRSVTEAERRSHIADLARIAGGPLPSSS